VTDRQTRALSFGSVASDYDRFRPSPPAAALDLLIPPGAQAVLDLAAGTGAVTRMLAGRAPGIIAVEPDERMRAVLSAGCPAATVLAGQGEDIPLPDASVDVVVISSAWHWLDPERAVPEITRVLRVGGVLGVIWISRDTRVPWVAEFNQLARESREADRAVDGEPARRRRAVEFPAGTPLSAPETFAVEYSLPMTSEQLFGLISTYSGVIPRGRGAGADFSRRVRAFLDRQPWDHVDLPLICRCLRSVRLPG